MDKGYHDNAWLADLTTRGIRTYVPERRQKSRRWTNKPAEYQAAFRANRRRVRGKKGRQLNRWRSERCEQTFAQVCETGGGRRSWLRGQTNVSKAHTFKCAAYNLRLLLRKVWGMCKLRSAKAGAAGPFLAISAFALVTVAIWWCNELNRPLAVVAIRAFPGNRYSAPRYLFYPELLEKTALFNGLLT